MKFSSPHRDDRTLWEIIRGWLGCTCSSKFRDGAAVRFCTEKSGHKNGHRSGYARVSWTHGDNR